MSYDCFGAGQKVTQTVYHGKSWQDKDVKPDEMYRVFLAVYQLHQMLWYLNEAALLLPEADIYEKIESAIQDLDRQTRQTPEALLKIDLEACREKTHQLLKKVWHRVQKPAKAPAGAKKSWDFIGRDFKKAVLDGQDFSMSLLIAANLEGCSLRGANFLGADLRDANFKNADLQESVFLTQAQVNTAKGNAYTKLPKFITRPEIWKK